MSGQYTVTSTGNMLCVVFVIALALPSLALAGEAKKEKTCTNPAVYKAGEEFYTCLDIEVNNRIKQENKTCSKPLYETIKDYVDIANNTCYKDPSRNHKRTLFPELLKYSLTQLSYKTFVESKGIDCINKVKNKIDECVTKEQGKVIKSTDDKYLYLWKDTRYSEFNNKTCRASKMIKICSMTAIRNETICKLEHSLFVNSLFEFGLEMCNKRAPDWNKKPASQLNFQNSPVLQASEPQILKKAKVTHIMLAVLLVLILLTMMYIVVRDCRHSRGFSHIKENIEMPTRGRRRSLVENENKL